MRLWTFLSYPLFAIDDHEHQGVTTSPTQHIGLQSNHNILALPAISICQIPRGGGGTEDETEDETMKSCPCVLCGQEIVASCQADCEAHMLVCPAFNRVHPESGGTNPDGVYPPSPPSKPIEEMSIKELRAFISESGFSDKDCIEKQDLQARAREASSSE